MTLHSVTGDDPREILGALRAALSGDGPVLGLGLVAQPHLDAPGGTAVVIATSGSSGHPKSVMLPAASLRASAEATAERIGAGSWLLALPASYVAGVQVLTRSIIAGTEPVFLEASFSPEAFAAATAQMPPGHRLTSLVPAQLSRLLDAADDVTVRSALQSFDAIVIGGQALPVATLERAQSFGARIVRTYGSTETSGGCVYDGMPLPGVTLRIERGEVQVSGPTLAAGYLGDPELTAKVFVTDAGGARWYRTGDAGMLDEGMLRIQGRVDNVIVSGGVNVSLDRVERVVRGIPGLADAVVVAVEDARWGEASVVVAPRGDALRRSEAEQFSEARHAVATEIGAPARPSRLVLVDELPTLPSGKPDREAIRRGLRDLH